MGLTASVEAANRLQNDRLQSFATCVHIVAYGPPHPWVPEFLEMIGDAGNRFVLTLVGKDLPI